MSKLQWLIAMACVMLCSPRVRAQSDNKLILSIEEMYRLADENSTSMKSHNIGIAAAKEAVDAAKAQRLPDIEASVSGSFLGNGYLWDRHFRGGQSIHIPHWSNNFALQASQTVYAGGAISSGIASAELSEQLSQIDKELNRQDIRLLLTGYYLDIYKLDNQERVYEKNIALTQLVLKNMETKHKVGTVLRNDITRYELQLETLRLQLTKIRDARKILNHQLATTLHLSSDINIVPDTTLLSHDVLPKTEQEWQEMAASTNLSLQQSQLKVLLGEQQVKQERSALLPKVAIIAEEHLDGPITIEVPTLNNNFNYWFVGVGIKYNIASLFKSNKRVKQARLQVNRAQEEHSLQQERVENAVQAAYTNFLTAFTELRTQEKKTELADQNYNVTANRYDNGLALLTDMLDASNTKIDADLGLVNARINVIYNYYKMKYTTHTL